MADRVTPAVAPAEIPAGAGAPSQPRRWSLLWRLLGTNAAVIATALLFLSLSPATVPSPGSLALESALLLTFGLTAMLVANLFLLRRALAPLRRLTELMAQVDPLRPGQRIPIYGHEAEVVELTEAFNDMSKRLEDERRDATRRAVAAQEDERRRIARELHDEIGQGLTAALLQLDGAMKVAGPSLRPKLAGAAESVRGSLEEARAVASRLRPEALDDLGLVSAVSALGRRLASQTGLRIDLELYERLPSLDPDDEIVVYRVAQEALTNVLRHANASRVRVCLERHGEAVRLRVEDDGDGLDGAKPGGGMQGMRERAALIGALLTIASGTDGGLAITLDVPLGTAA